MKSPPRPLSSTGPVELPHFSASLPMLLLRAREAVMVRFRAMLREHGLTEQQWRVLRAVQAIGRPEVSELAQATFLLPPSLSRILPDLQRRGLLTTELHAADQRRKVVRVTPAGRAMIAEVAPQSEAIYRDIHGRVGADAMAELEVLLLRIEGRLAAV